VGYAVSAALLPIPMADLAAVTAVQLNMLRQLSGIYNVRFMDSLGKNVITALVGSGLARMGASAVKMIPGLGTLIGELTMPILSGTSTYALGRVVAKHFANGGTFEDLDFRLARRRYEEEVEEGKKVAKDMTEKPTTTASKPDDIVEKLKKLAELRDASILSDAEFQEMKIRLLDKL
jgi:uncharacterized protein (DUF697 family)